MATKFDSLKLAKKMALSETGKPLGDIVSVRTVWWLRLLTPPVLALALYSPVLRMPFFWDDVANFSFLEGRSMASLWFSAAGFPYYRPLGFSLFRVWQWLFGATNTMAFHSLNLLVLTCNGWMLGLLALRLWPDSTDGRKALERDSEETLAAGLFAWLASTLLCSFPFAAIVVPLVASLFHLLVTSLVLLAGLATVCYWRGGHGLWALVMVVCAGLAPFAHESGVAAGLALSALWFGLAVKSDGTKKLSIKNRSGHLVLVAVVMLNAIFPLWWRIVDKMRTESGLPNVRPLAELWHNAVFFLDALTFPVQPLSRLMAQVLPWKEVYWVTIVGMLALGWAAILLWRSGNIRLLLVGISLFAILSLPAIFTLPQLYVVVSPRLTVLPAVGAALLWGGVISVLALRSRRIMLMSVLLSGALLVVPVRYILSRVSLHTRALEPVWGLVRAAQSFPNDSHLVVNATTWLALSGHTYPLVHDGVVVIPEYHNPGDLASIHTDGTTSIDGVNFPLVAEEPERHYYDVWGEVLHWEAMAERLRQYDRVWLTTYGDGPLGFVEVGNVLPHRQNTVGDEMLAIFDDGRIGLRSGTARMRFEDEVTIELQWEMYEASSEDVFVHAFDCGGKLLGMSDGPPLGRMFPFWLWVDGERVRDVRRISIADWPTDGCMRVEVGLFDVNSGVRLAVRGADGRTRDNHALVLNVVPN